MRLRSGSALALVVAVTASCSSESDPSEQGDAQCAGAPLAGLPDPFPVPTADCQLRLSLRIRGAEVEVSSAVGLENLVDDILSGRAEDTTGATVVGLDVPSTTPGTYYGGNPFAITPPLGETTPGTSVRWSRVDGDFDVRLCNDGWLEMVVEGQDNGVIWGTVEGVACDFVNATAVGGDVVLTYDTADFVGEFAGAW